MLGRDPRLGWSQGLSKEEAQGGPPQGRGFSGIPSPPSLQDPTLAARISLSKGVGGRVAGSMSSRVAPMARCPAAVCVFLIIRKEVSKHCFHHENIFHTATKCLLHVPLSVCVVC